MEQWRQVDEGWGRRAAEEASLHEPQNVREYVAMHALLGVGTGAAVLDVACGAGLAVELATGCGAAASGIDASPRLLAVARSRVPDADLRVGDMRALPWGDDAFDLVTSFRGIWGTTPEVLGEVRRVLRPGGRLGLTVWGRVKASPGAWALVPFRWADDSRVAHQAAMNSLGKPGVGEEVLRAHGFEHVQRVSIPFAWEFPDPATFARALAATGPGYEAIVAVGEDRFLADAQRLAEGHIRAGLPLRAEIPVVGFMARKPLAPAVGPSFLTEPSRPSTQAEAMYDDDVSEVGFVMNSSRLWSHDPAAYLHIFRVLGHVTGVAELSVRDRGILVTATAATIEDAYCSLSWGGKLAAVASAGLSHGVLTGDDSPLDRRERVLAQWARAVSAEPNAIRGADVEALREVGYDEAQILAITVYIALRIAFSTVNGALGAVPDGQLRELLPASVLSAVAYGRPIAGS